MCGEGRMHVVALPPRPHRGIRVLPGSHIKVFGHAPGEAPGSPCPETVAVLLCGVRNGFRVGLVGQADGTRLTHISSFVYERRAFFGVSVA